MSNHATPSCAGADPNIPTVRGRPAAGARWLGLAPVPSAARHHAVACRDRRRLSSELCGQRPPDASRRLDARGQVSGRGAWADVNGATTGNTPVHYAAARGDNEMCCTSFEGCRRQGGEPGGQTTVDAANGPRHAFSRFRDGQAPGRPRREEQSQMRVVLSHGSTEISADYADDADFYQTRQSPLQAISGRGRRPRVRTEVG